MRKGKAFKIYKRAMAFFMAAALVVSTFQGMSITAYATENVMISDADSQETEEIIEETAEETATPEVTPEPEATQEPAVEATATPEVTPEPEATQEPAVEATATPEVTPEPEATQEPEAEATATPVVTPEPEATQEPALTYIGDADTENKSLVIEASAISETYETFSDDILIDILDANRSNYYQSVTIVYDEVKNVINKTVWNMAVELLTGDAPELSMLFPGGTAPGENWFFVNPKAAESDLDTSLEMTINNDGGGVTVTFNNTTFPADSVALAPYSDSTKTEHDAFKAAFYQRYEAYSTCIRDADGNDVSGLGSAFMVNEDGSARFIMELYSKTEDGISQLESGTAYTIMTPYNGIVWEDQGNGTVGLDIVPREVGRESFTLEEIQRTLAEHGDSKFDEIYTEYPLTESSTVSADVINAMSGYLTSREDADQYIRIGFYDEETQETQEWRICNPTKQTEDKTVSAVLSAEEGSEVTIQVSGASFHADRTDVVITYGNETATANRLKDCFGWENMPLALDGLETGGYYEVYEDHISMAFEAVSGYDADTAYIVADGRYFGEIQTDEANNQRLIIDYHELWNRGQDASPEAFVDILNRYSGNSFVAVHITVPAGEDDRENEIDKGIYNAALKLLTTQDNKEGIYYNFNHDEKNILWYLSGGSALTKNVTLKYEVYINEYGKAALKVNLPSEADLGKASASLAIEYLKGTGEADMFQEFLGEGTADGMENVKYRLFPKESIEIPVKWVDMGETLKLGFMFNLGTLTKNAEYTIIDMMPGHVNEQEWGRELSIGTYDIGKASLAAGDLADCLSHYIEAVEAGEIAPFSQIHVEQPYVAGKNTIRKDDINLLLKLLPGEVYNDENHRNLTFAFCNCEYDEGSDINYTYDMNWNLFNPKTATKNINANATLKSVPNQGMSFKVTENTYKADDVALQFRIHKDLEMGTAMVKELGNVVEDGRELVVLKKKDLSFSKKFASCWGEDDNSVYSLYINNMAGYAADTEYLVAQVHDLISDEISENRFFIGDNENNVTKLSTTKTPDAGTAVAWKSYDTSALRIAADGSSVEALNQKEVFYAASYKAGGVQTLEVYKNLVKAKLNNMQFNRDEVVMTLPEEGADWTAEDFLSLQFYPSVAGRDQHELEWQVEVLEGEEGVPVIELYEVTILTENENGEDEIVQRNDGGIRAVNPGKVRVTATDPATGVWASCIVIVQTPAEVPEYAWPEVWAVTNFDTTLETVEFHVNEDSVPEGETVNWRWENPTMSLTTFKNMDGHDFNAIYTLPDGREITCKIWVRMVTLESLRVMEVSLNDDTLGCEEIDPHTVLNDGESIILNFALNIKNGGYDEVMEYMGSDRVSATWTSNPAGIGTQEGIEDNYWPDSYKFTADLSKESTGKGKKTFTVTLKDKITGKEVAKGTHTVTVIGKPLTAWDEAQIDGKAEDENKVGIPGEKGTLIVKLPKEGYNKLTFTSLDTGICKLGKKATVDKTSEEGYVITKIPYEIKAAGTVFIKITSDDEIKSNIRLERQILDIAPKYAGGTVQYNKKEEDLANSFEVQLADGCVLTLEAPEDYTLSGKGSEYFDIVSIGDPENGKVQFVMYLVNTEVPVGNYTFKLNLGTVTYNNEGQTVESSESYTVNIPVKVTASVPTVKFGQREKVNLFYTDEEGYAELTSTSGGYWLTDLVLTDCDYELIYPEDGLYLIKLKEGASGADKKGKISYSISGYQGTYSKNFTVGAQKKAPNLKVSAKADVLYPTAEDNMTALELFDKATNEPVEIVKLEWIKNANKKQYVELPVGMGEEAGIIDMKNVYFVNTYYNSIELLMNVENPVAKKDKIELRVWEENWKEPVKVSYSITTVLNTPKLALANKTITINVNEDVYKDQMAGTKLLFDDATESVKYAPVSFVGTNAKSREILNDNFVLEYWDNMGLIWARFNARNLEDRPATGTYTYNVYTEVCEKTISTKLTVKIVDVPVSKCLTVTKKGSIDVLNREGTSITYTPKLTSATGVIQDAWLVGRDADMFESYYDGKKLVVQARIGTTYSTNYSYQVQPVFRVQNEYGSGYEITGKAQSIKVKQGKVNVTVSAVSNVLYRDRANEMEIFFKATSEKKTPVVIEDVNLVNYQSDLLLKEWPMIDNQDNEYTVHFNPDTQSVTLSQEWINQIVAKNKTWKVKFEVRFRDKAGNTSTQQVTYKIAVK